MVFPQIHGLSCIGQFRAHQIGDNGFQKAVRFLPIKGFLAHEPCKRKGNPKVFEESPVYHGQRRHIPKQHDGKQRYHEPRHLRKRDRERQLKVIDGI